MLVCEIGPTDRPGGAISFTFMGLLSSWYGFEGLERKTFFVLHLRNLEEDTLVSLVYKEQKFQKWPGLAAETLKICEALQIEDVNETKLNISSYKQYIMEALHTKNEEKLRSFGLGKCERLATESYGKKRICIK